MPRSNDESLIAYLDGELDEAERGEIALWLERDAGLRERAARLGENAALLRAAFDAVLHEPVPERLIAAARGATATVVDLAAARAARWQRIMGDRPWVRMAVAASLLCLFVGTGIGWIAGIGAGDAKLASTGWLDNIAGYHRLYINADGGDLAQFDVPAGQKLPPDFRVPNLKPWGLDFQGMRYLFIEGRRAAQLYYTTDNKALGPLTVVVANTAEPDMAPTPAPAHGDVNVLYWRYHGHAYALAGTTNLNYLWNIHNDIAYQLDGI